MKGRKRAVISGCVHHIYQRTLNGELIFYTIRDHLVHFSILSVCARRYRLTILALCQMPEHLHLTAKPLSKKQLADFVRDATACFVREYNRAVGRTGPLFDSRFGSAPKTKEKKVRENLVYVYNNAGERGLCTYAEEYPWNFLAYATSEHPFSNPFVYSKASWRMKKAIREAKARARSGDFLRYSFLERIFAGLDREESAQLSDMLVRLYYFIDFEADIAYYGSFEKMLAAIHSNTGTEYDNREVFDAGTDRIYAKMSMVIYKLGRYRNIREATVASPDEKVRLFHLLQEKTEASGRQIAKFLHMM